MGAVMFVVDWFIASPLTAATGISGIGGMVSTLFWATAVAFGALVVRKFGSFTLMHFIYGFLTIFAPITFLPSIFKVVLFTLMGLVTDLIVLAFKYSKVGYYTSLILGHIFFFVGAFLLYTLLGIPTTSQIEGAEYLIVVIPLVTLVACGFGVLFGYVLYNKFKSRGAIKQLQD